MTASLPPLSPPFCIQVLDRKSLPFKIYKRRYLGELAVNTIIVSTGLAVAAIGFVLLSWSEGQPIAVGLITHLIFGCILMLGLVVILAVLLTQRQRERKFLREVGDAIRCEVYLTHEGVRLKFTDCCFDLSASSFSEVEYAKGAINLQFAPFSFILKNDESAAVIVAHLSEVKLRGEKVA